MNVCCWRWLVLTVNLELEECLKWTINIKCYLTTDVSVVFHVCDFYSFDWIQLGSTDPKHNARTQISNHITGLNCSWLCVDSGSLSKTMWGELLILWCDFKCRPWAKNVSPNTNDLYIHYMDKSTGTPLSLEEKKALPNCCNKDGNIIHVLKNCISTSVATVLKCMKWLYLICTSYWCLVMNFWLLKVCI